MAVNSLAESLTQQFYLWEQRGRGWQVWDYPVDLEPPFVPFCFHRALLTDRQIIDDGRKPTILSSIVDGIRGIGSREDPVDRVSEEWMNELVSEPPPSVDQGPIRTLKFSLPPDEQVAIEQSEHFLLSASLSRSPIGFEIHATSDMITPQFSCREHDLAHLEGSLRAFFPTIAVENSGVGLDPLTADNTLVIDFGLSEEFMRPIRLFQHFNPDPLTSIVAALEDLRFGEEVLLQVLFNATRHAWTQSILRSVSDGQGGTFFADAPEMLQLAREKTTRPLFASIIRLSVTNVANAKREWEIARRVAGAVLAVTTNAHSNELIPLTNDECDHPAHARDVIARTSHRSGMILSSRELLSLVHPLSATVHSAKLSRFHNKTQRAPTSVRRHELVLGENIHHGEQTLVTLNESQRLRHTHIVGATGTGKSTLLLNLIIQDIERGRGLAVIDPHGDLIDKAIGYIPNERFADVVLLDPSDPENHNGVNILAAKSEVEKNVATSDLVSVFKRLSTSWGDQMTSVLGNAIQAFLESDRGGTLIDLRRFLLEVDFRRDFLRTVEDRDVQYFWEKQYPIFRGNTVASLLTRLDTFLRPKLIKKIIAPHVDLNFEEILNHRKILLIKLAQGLIGEENTSLLGSLLVSKLHQAAMGRQTIKEEDREPFFLYIDEFQNFITPSLAGVLSGTRKYGLGLVLAHQEMRQIWDQDTGVANSLLSNPATRICFRVGDFDAQKLQDGFAHFEARDLLNLSVGEAIGRVDRAEDDFTLRISQAKVIARDVAEARRVEILKLSRIAAPPADAREGPASEIPPGPATPSDRHDRSDVELSQKKAPRTMSFVRQEVDLETRPEFPIETEKAEQGREHVYLQTLIKQMGQAWGYKVTVEEPTPDGKGRVDVGLTKDNERIACEISVTTSDEHELANIQKSLAAGYITVVVCSSEKKRLDKIQALASTRIDEADKERVLFLRPEEIPGFFEERASKEETNETRVNGYRVKVKYQSGQVTEEKKKRDAVAQVVLQSIRRMKSK